MLVSLGIVIFAGLFVVGLLNLQLTLAGLIAAASVQFARYLPGSSFYKIGRFLLYVLFVLYLAIDIFWIWDAMQNSEPLTNYFFQGGVGAAVAIAGFFYSLHISSKLKA